MRGEAITRMAEADLNKRLFVGTMEATAELTTGADKRVLLPGDYVQMRRSSVNGAELQQWPLGDIQSGMRQGYAVSGGYMVTSWANRSFTINYYRGLIPLSLEAGDWLASDWDDLDWETEASTNWLLEQDPELYIYAMLKQWFLFNATASRGSEAAELRQKAVDAGGYLMDIVNERNALDIRARYGGQRFRTSGYWP